MLKQEDLLQEVNYKVTKRAGIAKKERARQEEQREEKNMIPIRMLLSPLG